MILLNEQRERLEGPKKAVVQMWTIAQSSKTVSVHNIVIGEFHEGRAM
jgi:hypothetical protein